MDVISRAEGEHMSALVALNYEYNACFTAIFIHDTTIIVFHLKTMRFADISIVYIAFQWEIL